MSFPFLPSAAEDGGKASFPSYLTALSGDKIWVRLETKPADYWVIPGRLWWTGA